MSPMRKNGAKDLEMPMSAAAHDRFPRPSHWDGVGTYDESIVRVELVKNRADLIPPNTADV